MSEYHKEYYKRNRDRLIKKAKENIAKQDPEKRKARLREWYARTKSKRRFQNRTNANRRYAENPEKHRQRAKEDRNKLRDEFLTEYGGKCQCCGEIEKIFLTLEHINRDGKAHRDSVSGGHTSTGILRDLKRRGWPKDNYELLCFNCNRASWILGVCPHRTNKEKQTT